MDASYILWEASIFFDAFGLNKTLGFAMKDILVKKEVKRTARSSCKCEYHIVFAPKYRRSMLDHIYMLVSIPAYMNVT